MAGVASWWRKHAVHVLVHTCICRSWGTSKRRRSCSPTLPPPPPAASPALIFKENTYALRDWRPGWRTRCGGVWWLVRGGWWLVDLDSGCMAAFEGSMAILPADTRARSLHTMIRACARRGVGCASTGRARRPWVMMAEGAGGGMRVGGEGWCGRAHAARTVPLACAYRLVNCLGRMAGPCPVQYDGSVAERLRSRVAKRRDQGGVKVRGRCGAARGDETRRAQTKAEFSSCPSIKQGTVWVSIEYPSIINLQI